MSKNVFTIHEVEIHYARPINVSMSKVSSMSDAETVLRESIEIKKLDHKEFFWVLLLNHSNCVLGIAEIGRGTTSQVVVNNKEIFQLAIRSNASAIILAHNHPSGNLKPSRSDIMITTKLKDAGKLLDIEVFDHLILTSEGCTSLMEEGHL